MKTKSKVPADFPVKPLRRGENPPGKTTCGTCGRSWDDDICTEWTPAPSGRCPFEYFHDEPEPERAITSKTFIGPTCGAVRAAKIIMAGEKAINTDYGRKSVIGLAEIIDRESGLRGLLETIEAIKAEALKGEQELQENGTAVGAGTLNEIIGYARAAIAKCLPRG